MQEISLLRFAITTLSLSNFQSLLLFDCSATHFLVNITLSAHNGPFFKQFDHFSYIRVRLSSVMVALAFANSIFAMRAFSF